MDHTRIQCESLQKKIISAAEAASFIQDGMTVAIPHFICFDNPVSIAREVLKRHQSGDRLGLHLISAAACTPVIDQEWVKAGIIKSFMPYVTAPLIRSHINTPGSIEFMDYRLSLIPDYIRHGFLGDIDVALVSVAGITADGRLKPSVCSGYTQTVLNSAKKVFLEINLQSSEEMYLLHDVYEPGSQPNRRPVPILHADDVIGSHYYTCDPEKIAGIVLTDEPLYLSPMWYPLTADEAPPEVQQMAEHFVEFLQQEVSCGNLSRQLPPIQTGGGMVAGTILRKMSQHFKNMEMYTEAVLEDGMTMLKEGSLRFISTAGFGCSGKTTDYILRHPREFEGKLMVRPCEISNNPEVIRRLGLMAMNNIVEADIYGNINSTHVLGTKIISGVGGALDFAQNAALSCYFTLSTAKDGAISSIVPSCSHVDITEHDANIIVTEYGVADLRNKSPRQRAEEMIRIAHPDYRPLLRDYYTRAVQICGAGNAQTPHLLDEMHSWHIRLRDTGNMLPSS